ncbi:MAG: S24 family peptidase [Caldilinea sp.]
MNFSDLSDRQQRILHFIIEFTKEHHYPPTIRQIGDRVDISSTSVVNYNLGKLEEHKLISRDRDVSRGLSINYPRLFEIGFVGDLNGGSDLPRTPVIPVLGAPEYDEVEPSQEEKLTPRRFRVPLLGKIAAGTPIAVNPSETYDPEDWIELAEGMLNLPADNLFALRVQGDSMIDASVLDGDIVILRHQETANDGDMVAAWIEGDEETTLKYLHRDGPNVRLVPANPNPEYRPIVRSADKVRINGKVVSVIRVLR